MWIGGLFTLSLAVLLLFAYIFSINFYKEYPNEDIGPSTYACGETIRNVKYESALQSLSIPLSKEEQPIFDLLNKQDFTLHIDLFNTIASCQDLAVYQILGLLKTKLNFNCINSNGILSAYVKLSFQKGILKWIINDIVFVGGIRITLSASEEQIQFYQLKQLNFSETFYDYFNRTLAQMVNINLELTKVNIVLYVMKYDIYN